MTGVASLHRESERSKKKTRRQGVAVCVALRVSARPGRKETKQEGKKCVLRPTGPRRTPTRHGSLSAPFVAAPPHACSRRGAQGRRHERVGGCASGAVGRETHGTPHRKSAEETIKEGRVEKKKSSIVIAPKAKKKRDEGAKKKKDKNKNLTHEKKKKKLIRQDFHVPCSTRRSGACAHSLHKQKRKQKKEVVLSHHPTKNPLYSMRHPACSSSPPLVQSAGRAAVRPAPRVGKKRETKVRNTSLIMDCSNRP
ncbi:hypothetical protein ECC02_008482 [Trypanosoma cruzi]|uniref:Uncharacterized protein n=1 Tax=Trypanosoma cruzi TaxID=5693 RepID=A0A7J6XVK6_TRYCR|nr:hypothetical protein ECC02_008482 [Trypanosoma cruzi]